MKTKTAYQNHEVIIVPSDQYTIYEFTWSVPELELQGYADSYEEAWELAIEEILEATKGKNT